MKTIKWELPFKNMHYLNSLTDDLAENPHIILITGVQTEAGAIDRCIINIRHTDENMDNIILNIGAIIGRHEANYERALERKAMFEFIDEIFSGLEEEVSVAREQESDGGPKGEDFKPEDKEEVVEEKEILDGTEHILKEREESVEIPEEVEEEQKKELVEEVVETTEEAIKEEEKIEEVVKEIVEIAPKVSKAKDNKFVAALRVILTNFKK